MFSPFFPAEIPCATSCRSGGGRIARQTLQTVEIEATMSNDRKVEQADVYDFEGSFRGKPVAGAIAVRIEPYQTLFAHYVAIQVAEADKWKGYAPTLNRIASSIWLTDVGEELSSLPPLTGPGSGSPSTSGEDEGSSITSSYSYKQAVEDRASQKWSDTMLGSETVESESTGEQYQAPFNSWNSTGPDGPGYYRELPGGGGVEKLDEVTT